MVLYDVGKNSFQSIVHRGKGSQSIVPGEKNFPDISLGGDRVHRDKGPQPLVPLSAGSKSRLNSVRNCLWVAQPVGVA